MSGERSDLDLSLFRDDVTISVVTSNPTANVVMLTRVVEGQLPAHCAHGRTQCLRCRRWVWLGHETYKLITSGEVRPVCTDCADWYVTTTGARRIGRVEDHLRANGPHA